MTISGAYSCLRVQLEFGREVSFFLQTIYFPCFIIVIVSWMSFWIDHKAVSQSTYSPSCVYGVPFLR